MTRRELLLEAFDDHIITLRILAKRSLGADCIEDAGTLLVPDWRSLPSWYDSLWLFELEGIKASGYPGVLDEGDAAGYATPQKFVRFASRLTFVLPLRNRTQWTVQWRALPLSEVELDPRYVAFRTMFDWIILSAKVLAERGDAFDDRDLEMVNANRDLSERRDPFAQKIRTEDDHGEPVGLLCGNPRERLLGTRLANRWDRDFIAPEWQQVERPWAAIQYLHLQGLLLSERLRYGALREQNDPRLTQMELLRPEVFAAYVAKVLARDDGALGNAWRERPVENVRCDPRFVAHKCGFDTQMILHMARQARTRHARDLGIPPGPSADDEKEPN